MRVQIDKDVDPGTLVDQLTKLLGRRIAVSARNPGQKDAQGKDLPGVVVLFDADTGEELPQQDQSPVSAVLTAHVVPPPAQTPAKALVEVLSTATTVTDLKAALLAYAGGLVDREDKAKQRPPRGRG